MRIPVPVRRRLYIEPVQWYMIISTRYSAKQTYQTFWSAFADGVAPSGANPSADTVMTINDIYQCYQLFILLAYRSWC